MKIPKGWKNVTDFPQVLSRAALDIGLEFQWEPGLNSMRVLKNGQLQTVVPFNPIYDAFKEGGVVKALETYHSTPLKLERSQTVTKESKPN